MIAWPLLQERNASKSSWRIRYVPLFLPVPKRSAGRRPERIALRIVFSDTRRSLGCNDGGTDAMTSVGRALPLSLSILAAELANAGVVLAQRVPRAQE